MKSSFDDCLQGLLNRKNLDHQPHMSSKAQNQNLVELISQSDF